MKTVLLLVLAITHTAFSQIGDCADPNINSDTMPCCSGYQCANITDSIFRVFQKNTIGNKFYYWLEPPDTSISECYSREIHGGKITSIEMGEDYSTKGFLFTVQEIKSSGKQGTLFVFHCGVGDSIFCRYPGKLQDNSYDAKTVRVYNSKPIGKEILKTKWPLLICYTIEKGSVTLGMTKEQVILSWGKPEKINRSVGSWGVHEQWVYEERESIVYFENGKLTSFQD